MDWVERLHCPGKRSLDEEALGEDRSRSRKRRIPVDSQAMNKRAQRLLGVLLIVCLLGAICFLVNSQRSLHRILPNPNGYDQFRKAALLAVSGGRPARDVSDDELRVLIEKNKLALACVRSGLTQSCRVPIEYERSYIETNMHYLAEFKVVSRIFQADGVLAEREGRKREAARAYLDGIRFGQEFCRGGLVIDRLVGVACEAINLQSLSDLAPGLDAPSCREIAHDLEMMEANREPFALTAMEERLYFRRISSLRESAFGLVQRFVRWCASFRTPIPNPKQKVERIQGLENRLLLGLAARAYRLENGKAPQRPADLVPAYLQAVPKDPITGKEMEVVP